MENYQEMSFRRLLKCASVFVIGWALSFSLTFGAVFSLDISQIQVPVDTLAIGDDVVLSPIDILLPVDQGDPFLPHPDFPSLPEPPVNSYAVGNYSGDFQVSNNGAALYQLTFGVPDGGVLTPQIGLSYNSQHNGYGLAGYGFQITGLSVITRGGNNLFYDGVLQGVKYSESDHFYLDGKRLILVLGNAGRAGAEYCVEGEPFTKVLLKGNHQDDFWFEIRTRDGLVYQYGYEGDSKLCFKGKSGRYHTASWYVSRIEDRYGNYTTYQYYNTHLCVRPSVITYGLNNEQNRGIVNKILFAYQTMGSTSRSFYVGNQQGKMDVRLSSVTTSSNNVIYRKYQFTYDVTSDQSLGKWSRLVKVEEQNGEGESFPPVQFRWSFLPSTNVQASLMEVSTNDENIFIVEDSKSFLTADMNGDGISDIIRVSEARDTKVGDKLFRHTMVYVSQSEKAPSNKITYSSPLSYKLQPSYRDKISASTLLNTPTLDFDGDGYTDLVLVYHQEVPNKHYEEFYIIWGSDVVESRAICKKELTLSLGQTKAPLFTAFDTDGNGKDDIVCIGRTLQDGYYHCCVVKHFEDETLGYDNFSVQLPQEPVKVFVGDYNNDGLSDLLLMYDGGYKIYFHNGGSPDVVKFSESSTSSGTSFGYAWRMQQGDFDGDGLIDIVYTKAGESNLWLAFNKGDGTFSCQRSVDIGMQDHGSCKDDNRFALLVTDFDRDGRSDVMVCKSNYVYRGFPKFKNEYVDTQVKWLYSTGIGLKLVKSYTKKREDDAQDNTHFMGDFDGDGYFELANYGSLLTSSDDSFDGRIRTYRTRDASVQSGKISQIIDGMGNCTNIFYNYATNSSVYKKAHTKQYPVLTYTLPLSVVERVRSEHGAKEVQEVSYAYEDFLFHTCGKGLLGFNAIIKENKKLGIKERTEVSRWNEDLWVPEEIKATTQLGNQTAEAVSNYAFSKINKNYFAYVAQKVTTDFDGNRETVLTNYDITKGVVTDEVVQYGGEDMYKKTVYNDYQDKGGIWLPAQVINIQKHIDDIQPFTTKTLYEYDKKGNVLTQKSYRGSVLLQTKFTYDAFGNVLSSTTNQVTQFYEYDNSGRFLTKRYTSPASSVHTFTYNHWGNLLSETDETNATHRLTTLHDYDAWGRKIKTLAFDGTQTRFNRGWGLFGEKKYFLQEECTGKAPVTTWYDKGGKEVMRLTLGAKGVPIHKVHLYNNKGQIDKVVSNLGKLMQVQSFSYDDRGRVLTDELSSGRTTTYVYGNRTVKTTTGGICTTQITDAWGNLIKSIDPSGEVTYVYSSVGKPVSVRTHGTEMSMEYDNAGRKRALWDPNAGRTTYSYANDDRLISQTDARGVTTEFYYDRLKRVVGKSVGGASMSNLELSFVYGKTDVDRTRLVRQSLKNCSVEYTYDDLGRVTSEIRNFGEGRVRSFCYEYNEQNQLSKVTYPGGLEVCYAYDDLGFKTQTSVGGRVIHRLEEYDGLTTKSSFMDALISTRIRDERGYDSRYELSHGSTLLNSFESEYDGATDNLLSRQRGGLPKEVFSFDEHDRLFASRLGNEEVKRLTYAPNGNILFKVGVGEYRYSNFHPHAVLEVDNYEGTIPSDMLTEYNALGKIERIEHEYYGPQMTFEYGPDEQRWISTLTSSDNGSIKTTLYAGDYESVTENGITREYYYLDDNVMVIKQGDAFNFYLAFTDNLGSILSVYDEAGHKFFDASYDAWGKQTVTLNEIGLLRGYTGHEMYSDFGIINMNGRLYDPILGRFFSPDNYVQMPENSQSFNRYSYCLNNPLKYTDPSGEFWFLVAGAALGGIINWAIHDFQFNFKGLGYLGVGALAGAVGAGVGAGMNVAMVGGGFWSGSVGWASGVSSTGFIAGAATGSSAGFAGGLISGAGNSWLGDASFSDGLLRGVVNGGFGALLGGLIGGISGGVDALRKGTNFWTGTVKLDLKGAYDYSNNLSPDDIGRGKITGKYVGKFEGVNVYESKKLGSFFTRQKSGSFEYRAFTAPELGIAGAEGLLTSGFPKAKAMLQHEFGHILQYRLYGARAYWEVIAPASLFSAAKSLSDHQTFWVEMYANYLSKCYFGKGWIGEYHGYPAKNIAFYYKALLLIMGSPKGGTIF